MTFQAKTVQIILLLTLCCIWFSVVIGKPSVELEEPGHALNRTKRSCVGWYGCWKGKCWAGCTALGLNGEWCYTGDGDGHIYCSENSQCNGCWSCVGACTVTDLQ